MQFKEAMETLNVKRAEAKKTREALEKRIKTRGQKKQRLEGEREHNTVRSTPTSITTVEEHSTQPKKKSYPKEVVDENRDGQPHKRISSTQPNSNSRRNRTIEQIMTHKKKIRKG
jgi:hypothetical protein